MGRPRIEEKRWSIDLEKKIQENHYEEDNQRYSFNPKSGKEIFVIDTPPPYPSGTWHIGAVAQYSMIDVIARSQRLLGKEVYFPWGRQKWNQYRIHSRKKYGKKMKTYDRQEFLDLCEETIEEYTQAMRNTAKRVGLSCDFEREYLTDAPNYRAVTQAIFIELFKKGHIIEDLRPNLYDPVEGTTIADAEVERMSRETQLIDVKWTTEDGEQILISTTRPELICACGIVVVHPDDTRYSHLVGKNVRLPVSVNGRDDLVQIATHPSVKSEFGSGILMVCSFGDQNDVAIFRELGLTPFQAIDLEGNMTSIAGPLEGMKVLDAREHVIASLKSEGLIHSIEIKMQDVPVSERGKNPIEIILLKEWYVKQTDVLDRVSELSKEITFHHPAIVNFWLIGCRILLSIGRYPEEDGTTEIPIWYDASETKIIVPPSGTYVRPWIQEPPEGSVVIDRNTRLVLGSYDDMKSNLGNLKAKKKYSIRVDGLIQL